MGNPHPRTDHLKATQWKPGESGFAGRSYHPPLPVVKGPARSVTVLKEAALSVLDDALRTYEDRIATVGVDEELIACVLKLLGGFNASLPKPNEKPARPLEDMSAEELRAFIAGKK